MLFVVALIGVFIRVQLAFGYEPHPYPYPGLDTMPSLHSFFAEFENKCSNQLKYGFAYNYNDKTLSASSRCSSRRVSKTLSALSFDMCLHSDDGTLNTIKRECADKEASADKVLCSASATILGTLSAFPSNESIDDVRYLPLFLVDTKCLPLCITSKALDEQTLLEIARNSVVTDFLQSQGIFVDTVQAFSPSITCLSLDNEGTDEARTWEAGSISVASCTENECASVKILTIILLAISVGYSTFIAYVTSCRAVADTSTLRKTKQEQIEGVPLVRNFDKNGSSLQVITYGAS